MRRRSTNEIFAVTGTGDGAGLIVRVGAGANYRRVANSSGHFVCRSAGRSRGGQITVLIKRNGTNGAVSILIGDYKAFPVTARTIFFRSLHLLQGIPALLRKKIFLIHQFDPVGLGECFRTRTVEHYMRRFFHHEPRKSDRILYVLHAADCTGLESPAIHDRRVHLIGAVAGEYGTSAGIEVRIVLEHSHGSFGSIET